MLKITDVAIYSEQKSFSSIDRHLAYTFLRLCKTESPELFLAALLASQQSSLGHVCAELADYAGKPFLVEEVDASSPSISATFPSLDTWVSGLEREKKRHPQGEIPGLVVVQHPEGCQVYLERYWNYQTSLAHYFANSLRHELCQIDPSKMESGLNRLFPNPRQGDLQRAATEMAVQRHFSILSGGPGTGKTFTVVKILALLLESTLSPDYSIALVAPTGKAAARLKESIMKEKQALLENQVYPPEFIERIPSEASTIHSILRPRRNSPYFYHNPEEPLLYDCVIVDEVSMVDLPLMEKLTSALLPTCRLILLGDKNQLSSVESGAVLGDLSQLSDQVHLSQPFPMVHLTESRRFDSNRGIGKLSLLVNEQRVQEALELLKAPDGDQIRWRELPTGDYLRDALRTILDPVRRMLLADDIRTALQWMQSFAILCAFRSGPYGVERINGTIEGILEAENIIATKQRFYAGRPVMITQNDSKLGLFNGDVGLLWWDHENQQVQAYFEHPDGSLRAISPSRLPAHETNFATTIHKSQGSDYSHVLLIFPDRDAPILTKELLYTGITRAKKWVTIWGSPKTLARTISHRVQRHSGLSQQIQRLLEENS